MAALDNPFYFSLLEEARVEVKGASARYYQAKPNVTVQAQGMRREEGCQDIAIVSCGRSEPAALWVNYLTSCFQQIAKEEKRPPFKVAQLSVEDVISGVVKDGGLSSSRLQIIIVCPLMLEAWEGSGGASYLASLLRPATVLAMLLGVSQTQLDSHHMAGTGEWRRLVVKDQDPTFVGDLMGVAMDILSRSWQLQQAMHQIHADNNKAHFSIVPKKIKVGQNKLIVLLTTPLSTTDKIKVTVEKSGQKVEVPSVKRRNPYTLQFSMPVACLQTSTLVCVSVERNGKSLGRRLVKCESRLRELDVILKSLDNPLNFLCQAVGAADREALDRSLVAALHKNTPPNFNLLSSSQPPSVTTSDEEYPTLLHVGARLGLERLCWALLELPGGEQAAAITNQARMTPAEVAAAAGHPRLAQALTSYQQMTELSSMYHYIKGISEKTSGNDSEANYLLPRPLSDTYSVPPCARPISLPEPLQDLYRVPRRQSGAYSVPPGSPDSSGACALPPSPMKSSCYAVPPLIPPECALGPPSLNCGSVLPEVAYAVPPSPDYRVPGSPLDSYQCPPLARPFTPATPTTPSSPAEFADFAAYLHMHSPISDQGSIRSDLDFYGSKYKNIDSHYLRSDLYPVNNRASTSSGGSGGKLSPQDELVEIINDFKNNVFTITEVEKLVEAWRNRNDVQQSFREKQDQLNQMRQEYERIQLAMKDQMKRATPFERIKKFFTRKSKGGEGLAARHSSESCQHRPVSSLSLHSSCSSSSSGRVSLGSGSSIGDSGTHSDHDEKKSQDFVFPHHEKLQSVQESENSGDDYVRASTEVVAVVHQEQDKEDQLCDELEERLEVLGLNEEAESCDDLEERRGSCEEMGARSESCGELSEPNGNCGELREQSKSCEELREQRGSSGELCEQRGSCEELSVLEQSERLLKEMAGSLPQQLPDYANLLPSPSTLIQTN